MKKIVILIGLVLLLAIFPLACGNAGGDWESPASSDMAATDEAESDMAVGDFAEEAPAAEMESEEDAAWLDEVEDEGNIGIIPILLPSESGRQLVYTADIQIETTEFMAGMRLLLDTIADLEGYSERVIVNGRHILRPEVERDAEVIFRLPTENLAEFLVFIEDNYNLVRLHKEMEDFTTVHEGRVSRIDDLREQEQRLLADLIDEEETDTTQADLDDVQDQIRRLQAITDSLRHDVNYSNITVQLDEVIIHEVLPIIEEEPPTFGERIQSNLGVNLEIILEVFQMLLLIIIAILPWLLIIAIIVVPIIFIAKKSRKKKGQSSEGQNQEPKI